MPRFNFNEITKSGKADIDLIGQNFEEIEENGITEAEVDAKIGGQQQFFVVEKQPYYKIRCLLTRRGKVVFCNVMWKINGGNLDQSAVGDYFIRLPDWAFPSASYADYSDSDHAGIDIYENVVPGSKYDYKTQFTCFFGNANRILWLSYRQNGTNEYEYYHAASFFYMVD